MSNLHGTDWSHWQGAADVKVAKGAGLVFFFFKATQGTTFKDSKFSNYRQQAVAENVIWAPYHFFMANLDPIAQAQHFFNTVGEYQGMPPVCDFELTYGMSKYTVNLRLRQFLVECERLFGRKPIIYTRGYFWNYWIYRADDWKNYPLWVANYGVVYPYMPLDWDEWGFWQYTEKGPGSKYGVSSASVDLNWCPWTLDELKEFAGFEVTPPPPPPPSGGYFESFVYADSLWIRTGPGTNFPTAGYFIKGDKVKVYAHEYNAANNLSWAKVSDTQEKWTAMKWLTMQL